MCIRDRQEVDRILAMHISPINISVHTTNPQLREKMMHNRFAGESLKYLEQLAQGGARILSLIHILIIRILCMILMKSFRKRNKQKSPKGS